MLFTKKEEIIYTLFNWVANNNSSCAIIAISNTLDLAERMFSKRIVSRMVNNLTFIKLRLILRDQKNLYFNHMHMNKLKKFYSKD